MVRASKGEGIAESRSPGRGRRKADGANRSAGKAKRKTIGESRSPGRGKRKADGENRSAGKGGATRRTGKKKRRADRWPLSEQEVRSIACHYFCSRGMIATEIRDRLKEKHGVDVTREEVFRFIREGAARGMIHYEPPLEQTLQRKIRSRLYQWLHDVSVVETAVPEHVSNRGAEMLLELLQQRYADGEVHIGFSGGRALRTLARRFSQLLREPSKRLPKRIVFHAMVAGFDVEDPTTDPNAFFTYFVEDPILEVETSFVALHCPAIAEGALRERLRTLPGIAESYERAHEIDIIVTSTSSWRDEHCILRRYVKASDGSVDELEKAECDGDILWEPIGPNGPLELDTPIRAMTLMKLSEVSDLIERDKKHVLLVAGPCPSCQQPKTEVVRAILDNHRQLVTHMALDSRCARALVAGR
jgi:DNA-binding transcriptional regulator LsrR (DeoR family)